MCGTDPDSICDKPCPRKFGLPTIMNGTTPISIREVPCALQPHVRDGASRKILGSLCDRGCKVNFLDWVENFRPYDPNTEEDERKMCPLIWCRKTFETNDLAIRHVFKCPRLSNAWYWCPYHRRPERFLECNKGCEIVRKPRMNQAAKFFNWFGRRWSLKGQASLEEKTLVSAYHEREHDQIPESPPSETSMKAYHEFNQGYRPELSSSNGRHSTITAGWADEKKASCPRHQPRLTELYAGEISELAGSHKSVYHEMYHPSTLAPMPSLSVSLQRRDSPELRHPINSEPNRDSLWQRRRGMSATDRHRSGATQCHSGRPLDDSSKTISPPSGWFPKLDDCLHTLPGNGNQAPTSKVSSENSILQDQQSDPSQFGTDRHAMSQGIALDQSISTADCPAASILSPVLPDSEPAYLPSHLLSPVSPVDRYVYPPSTIVSPDTVACDESIPGTGEHHADTGDGWITLGLSPLQSMPTESNDTRGSPTSITSHLQTLRTVHDGIESSASKTVLSTSTQPYHFRTGYLELEDTNLSGCCNDLSFHSTGPQSHSEDGHRQLAAQDHFCDSATSQALSLKSLPHCFNHNSLLASPSAPKQTQVEELQELFGIINGEWMQRMELLPELCSLCKTLSASSLFERAVRFLKDFIWGRCVPNFLDVYAFMHLAFAAAFSLHWQQDFYSWGVFCDHALLWQHVLSNDDEKVLFLRAMSLWWCHELDPTLLLNSIHHTSFDSSTLHRPTHSGSQSTILDILRNNEVFQVCTGFLDGKLIQSQALFYDGGSNLSVGFQRADIQERNDKFPAGDATSQTWEMQHMRINIIQPLLQKRGMEALQTIVIDTGYLIACGILKNTREVEATLLTSGRWNSESWETYERFYDSVTSQCDEAMLSSNSNLNQNWRNDYYINLLNAVLEISQRSGTQQSIEPALKYWPNTSVLATMGLDQTIHHSPIPPSSPGQGVGSFDSSPTSLMSFITGEFSPTVEVSSYSTSPTTVSQASTSPTSLGSSSPTNVVIRCRACSKDFKGSLQNAKSNYQRHLRESRRHNKDAGLQCPLPECRKRPPMRSDNLGPHLKKVHRVQSQSERRSIIEQSRSSAQRLNRESISGGTLGQG